MRRVDRSLAKEPVILSKTGRDGKNELQRVTDHMNGPDRAQTFEFSRYKEGSVKAELEKLFHGKCAYCESFYAGTQPVDVEHYRPKGEVEGLASHDGYWWLAMEWSNLLPSCIDCNRRRQQKAPSAEMGGIVNLLQSGEFDRSKQSSLGKSSAFPLDGENERAFGPTYDLDLERRLLLDPTRDTPTDHLAFHVDRSHLLGLVFPKPLGSGERTVTADPLIHYSSLREIANAANVSAMGMVSIQVYGLNRLGLVQARTKALRDLEFLLEMAIGLAEIENEIAGEIERKQELFEVAPHINQPDIESDIQFNIKIRSKISNYKSEALLHLKRMAEPQAPYSELARSWISTFLSGH